MAAPEGLTKLLYLVVLEDDAAAAADRKETPSFRYSRSVLQSTLQLMGCKPRHAFKVPLCFSFSISNRKCHLPHPLFGDLVALKVCMCVHINMHDLYDEYGVGNLHKELAWPLLVRALIRWKIKWD